MEEVGGIMLLESGCQEWWAPETAFLRQGATPWRSLCGLHGKGGTEQTHWKPARVL